MPGGWRLWLRWSTRDLRRRWVVVTVTGLVIAMGTGTYASLNAQAGWRREALDRSYAAGRAHDLRLTLPAGADARDGRLLAAVARSPARSRVAAAEERLVVPTQVDASRPGGPAILVPGRLVGLPVARGGPAIDRLDAMSGRSLRATDAGRRVAVLEEHFGAYYDLPSRGVLRVGGRRVPYVGRGLTPDWFLVTTAAGWGAESSLAGVFMPLGAAQRLSGRPGRVNELVVRVRPGADPRAVGTALRRAIRSELAGTSATVTLLAGETSHRTLYRDVDNDARIFAIYGYLLLAASAFSAFVLVSRVIEAQRREIGIGMALGVEPRVLAVRPLLMAAEVALLGVAFGVGVGLAFGALLSALIEDQLPLPSYGTLFDAPTFARAAAIGFAVPFAAAAWPVVRGVGMRPVEAIRVGARAAAGGGLAPLLRRLALPGGTLAEMPVRNVLRTPRRTILTVCGVAAVLMAFVSLAGMVDSMRATVDRGEQDVVSRNPDRLVVSLDGLLPRGGRTVRAIAARPEVGRARPGLVAQVALLGAGRAIDAAVELLDSRRALWTPALRAGALAPGVPGIVISSRAADQLGAHVGDTIVVRHPKRTAAGAVDIVRSRVPVAGIHRSPFRFLGYMDDSMSAFAGLAGLANVVTVTPAAGRTQDDVERALSAMPGVASVEPATALTDTMQKAIDEFLAAIVLTEGIVLVLALLIAFNTTSISADERRREAATMFAFGVPLGTALWMAMVENLIVGLLATALGLAGGALMTRWMVSELLPDTFPDLGATATLGAGSIAAAVLLGTLAVTIAPLFTVRRMARMDLPSTLRVVE